MGICSSTGTKFQLYKMNKLKRSAVHHVLVNNTVLCTLKVFKTTDLMLSVITIMKKSISI